MEWQSNFDSSNVRAFLYNEGTKELFVKFGTHGRPVSTYVYRGVPEAVYRAWVAAGSKGVFHAREIKNKYSYSRLN